MEVAYAFRELDTGVCDGVTYGLGSPKRTCNNLSCSTKQIPIRRNPVGSKLRAFLRYHAEGIRHRLNDTN